MDQTKLLNFVILVLLVPFGLAVLLSLSNGSFQRGWERGAARMAAESSR